jgi:hypothetical protein
MDRHPESLVFGARPLTPYRGALRRDALGCRASRCQSARICVNLRNLRSAGNLRESA